MNLLFNNNIKFLKRLLSYTHSFKVSMYIKIYTNAGSGLLRYFSLFKNFLDISEARKLKMNVIPFWKDQKIAYEILILSSSYKIYTPPSS